MPIEIEKNVPLPDVTMPTSRKYPFPDMEAGDSFALPCASKDAAAVAQRCRHAARAYITRNKHQPLKFSTRRTPEGVRCWRIA